MLSLNDVAELVSEARAAVRDTELHRLRAAQRSSRTLGGQSRRPGASPIPPWTILYAHAQHSHPLVFALHRSEARSCRGNCSERRGVVGLPTPPRRGAASGAARR